jgi:hypothetical protein
MKNRIFIALAFVASVGLSNQLFSQEPMEVTKTRTKSNQTNEKVSDPSKVVCTGKIRCADGTCSITFEQEIVSPRDAASGLPTGKRQHKPFVITMELDKSSPVLAKGGSGGGAGKASMSDLSLTFTSSGKTQKLSVVSGEFIMPNDCDDQDCDLAVSWSWGESNSGSSSTKRYQATFNLTVEKGEYMASKHKKTGHVSLLK